MRKTMVHFFQSIFYRVQGWFKPDQEYMTRDEVRGDGYSDFRERMAILVGSAAVFLPLFLIFSSVVGWTVWRDTISHHYYAVITGDILVGCLFFIGGFLFAYRGESKRESRLATFGGIAAIGIAIFPTSGPGVDPHLAKSEQVFVRAYQQVTPDTNAADPPVKLNKNSRWGGGDLKLFESKLLPYKIFSSKFWHAVWTGVFFFVLIVLSLFVFTRVKPEHRHPDGSLKRVKKIRNRIYFFTATFMAICMISIPVNHIVRNSADNFSVGLWQEYNVTFGLESISILLFGIAWLTKSKLLGYKFRSCSLRD